MQRGIVIFLTGLMAGFQLSSIQRVLPTFQVNRNGGSNGIVWGGDGIDRSGPRVPENTTISDLDYHLSVIITSSLIPIHPSINFINKTISSLLKLDGIPGDTPIYVTVDGIPPNAKDPNMTARHQHRLTRYIRNLRSASFYPFTNVKVLVMDQHRHISGSVSEALNHIARYTAKHYKQHDPSNHFVYLLQHDLYFTRSVPHTQLIEAMRQYPDDLRNIRFRYNYGPKDHDDVQDQRRFPPCLEMENGTVFERNGLPFFATARWSDNNQLSTLQYYRDMIVHIQNTTKNGRLNLPMEWVLMRTSNDRCREWGQRVLGDRTRRHSYLGHLDGRNRLVESPKSDRGPTEEMD